MMHLPRSGALFFALALAGFGQMLGEPGQNSPAAACEPGRDPQVSCHRPPAADVVKAFVANSVGPYSLFMALATAGIHQATDNPPDWRQGFPALSERFGSNIGITAIGNSARYGVGWAMNVDVHPKKCACRGPWPRLEHAVKNTATARRRKDGGAVLSIPNLIAPYVATTSAVYAWYPSRYGMKDAFRMGNYNLLGTLASNIVFEFMPAKAIGFLHRIHFGGLGGSDPQAQTRHP